MKKIFAEKNIKLKEFKIFILKGKALGGLGYGNTLVVYRTFS